MRAWVRSGFAVVAVAGVLLAAVPAQAAFAVTVLATGGTAFTRPLDAAPSPLGSDVYFTGRDPDGRSAVFRVPGSGGPVSTLTAGGPLVAARGIVVSGDGRTLYVADPAAAGGGAVFAVPADGGRAVPLRTTVGLAPRALDLRAHDGADTLYVAGTDPTDGRAGLWRVARPRSPAASATPLLRGSPLAEADGVAVSADGEIFLAGRRGRGAASDVVLRLRDGVARPLVTDVRLGSPAGLALTLDERTLLVSSLAADGGAQVLLVDLATGGTSTFNDVIGVNRHSGGLHRALHASVFGWADVSRPGRVYRVEP